MKNNKSALRYRIINHKRKLLCDYHGNCRNLAFKEVYPNFGEENEEHYWCYLCRKHFKKEKKKFKEKLVYCSIS